MITELCECGGWNKHAGWKIFMKSMNMEGRFFFCGEWNFSKSVSREMKVENKAF